MMRALELATQGRGQTSNNPMVGTVIVKNGRVIAEGYHRKAGTDHAEVVALKKAGKRAVGSTAYVTLEPCCHTGCTGPCSDALIRAGVSRVVYAAVDPNPMVKGKGARRLRRAGIKVESGLLRKEAERLNEAYHGFHRNGRPFVTLKMAQTLDGRIATATGDSQWISGPPALKLSHQLRAENDAILVGLGTVRTDDPALTVRKVKGKNPYRIVATASGKLPKSCQLLKNNTDLRTVVASTTEGIKRLSKKPRTGDLIYWDVRKGRRGGLDLVDFLAKARDFGIQSMLVEGGASLATSFLKAKLVDKIVLVVAPRILGKGTETVGDLGIKKLSRSIRLERVTVQRVGQDTVVSGYPNYRK